MKRAGGREEATREVSIRGEEPGRKDCSGRGEEEAGKGLREWNKGRDGEDGTSGRDWAGEGRRAEGAGRGEGEKRNGLTGRGEGEERTELPSAR